MESQSPLRRSDVGVHKTPVRPVINDDERERAAARKSFLDSTTTSSTTGQCEDLQMGLKLFQENKFTKENAWNIPLIDSFADLIRKHHQAVGNFQMAGYGLEASTKLYGIRVDSVHEKTMRLNSGLGTKKTTREDNDDAFAENQEAGNVQAVTGAKPKRKKRPKSTVTKNVETINGKLETVPLPEPIMAELRSILGNIANPKNLLSKKLSDRNGIFNLDSNAPLNYPDAKKVDVNANHDWSNYKKFTVSIEKIEPGDRLRPMHSHYEIKDTPAEEEEEASWDAQQLNASNPNNTQIALAFDMDAEVEPLPVTQDDFQDCEPMEQDFPDIGEMTEDDRAAILACKGVRPRSIHIRDLRPTDANHSRLEYSYRPMEMINQYWAGPSHWKFKRPSRSLVSMEGRQTGVPVVGQKRVRRVKVTLGRLEDFVEPDVGVFLRVGDAKLRQKNIRKKWEQKEKLKLPTDFKLDRAMCNTYKFAPGTMIREANSDAVQGILPIGDDYNYDNPVDRSYCSNVMGQDDTDTETGTEAEGGGAGIGDAVGGEEGVGGMEENAANATVGHFDMEYEGAPEKVEKIVLPYAKRAKIVDMKQLKKVAWHLTCVGLKSTDTISFHKLHNALPNHLSPIMRENLSVPLAFYAILHLANEHGLKLIQRENLKDVGIKLQGDAITCSQPLSQSQNDNNILE